MLKIQSKPNNQTTIIDNSQDIYLCYDVWDLIVS